MIPNLIQYLQNLKKRDITPEEFTVYEFPDRYTILQILQSIGNKLANLWDTVKITSRTETVDTGTPANVTVTGDADNLNFNFQIPGGEKGDPGPAGPQGEPGPAGPKGDPGPVSVTVGTTTTTDAGTSADVTNAGTAENVILNFSIPRGNPGEPGPQGPQGDTGPQGVQGETGPAGQAATITVGTTTTGEPGTEAQVTNSGTAQDAILNFTIPKGVPGDSAALPVKIVVIDTKPYTLSNDTQIYTNTVQTFEEIKEQYNPNGTQFIIKLNYTNGHASFAYGQMWSDPEFTGPITGILIKDPQNTADLMSGFDYVMIDFTQSENNVCIYRQQNAPFVNNQVRTLLYTYNTETEVYDPVSPITQKDLNAISDYYSTVGILKLNNIGRPFFYSGPSNDNKSLVFYSLPNTYGDNGSAIHRFNLYLDDFHGERSYINFVIGIPNGGTTGQLLAKKSDTSLDCEWVDAASKGYTKAQSDARYAPIAAAIRPTVSGNPATLEHSVAWALQGLSVYGKSTQDGSPSTDSPVPIMSAGESGSIAVTVSDGADQSQQLSISTPNGLPGIPVDSGGNFTDETGQQWICDEVNFARGVYVQRCALEKISGTPNFVETPDYLTRYIWSVSLRNTYGNGTVKALSTFGTWSSWAHGNVGTMALYGKSFYFKYGKSNAENEVNAAFTNLIENNQCYVLGQLATPTETPLSEEELAAYAALHSYDGTTVVQTVEDVASLTARAIVDPVAYIDSKIQSAINL